MLPGTATVVQIDDITPIPGSDKLELARVGDWYSVIETHRFVPGQLAVFIAEHSVLPQDLIAVMGAAGKLSGKQGNTVKKRELCGCVSHGVLYPVDSGDGHPFIVLPTDDGIGAYFPVRLDMDVTAALGIQPSSHLNHPTIPF